MQIFSRHSLATLMRLFAPLAGITWRDEGGLFLIAARFGLRIDKDFGHQLAEFLVADLLQVWRSSLPPLRIGFHQGDGQTRRLILLLAAAPWRGVRAPGRQLQTYGSSLSRWPMARLCGQRQICSPSRPLLKRLIPA